MVMRGEKGRMGTWEIGRHWKGTYADEFGLWLIAVGHRLAAHGVVLCVRHGSFGTDGRSS